MQPKAIENPNLEDLAENLGLAFPAMNQFEQKVSLQLYRLLCRGRPITRQMLADRLGMPIETVRGLLKGWHGLHIDGRNRIAGYRGLTLEPTRHRFEVGGLRLYTWCAWDTLFLPEILRCRARIESRCATTGAETRLILSPDRVEELQPETVVISFMIPEAARVEEGLMAHFCRFVHFFESDAAGLAWTDRHPGTFLLTIDQAHLLGHRINRMRYPNLQKI